MTTLELLSVLFIGTPVWIVAGMLGRKCQRVQWMLDEPYEERRKAFCKT